MKFWNEANITEQCIIPRRIMIYYERTTVVHRNLAADDSIGHATNG